MLAVLLPLPLPSGEVWAVRLACGPLVLVLVGRACRLGGRRRGRTVLLCEMVLLGAGLRWICLAQ